ncbi:mitochondrial exoribonuclease Cyt-4 [Aspergillus japonicus CBS 114.51]|uniref:Mitochondrial exoribonuclease Cyt-4 n=1 Tax=Aspergillus japonicus CBS 114.51 TaxID=1448312 RepID=A0A8T8WPW4_ASPJA|nr:mitochondrial exoribonuclease Cyt-4 [Aspergillus japonicus CBS 114.51]RAH77713.1 mitochondrial exoribonuclease Cyt-4 [Aspergillus japonicus CBS 114.51]
MYDGCSRMPLLLSKARVPHRVAGVNRYASNLKLVRTCGIAASRVSPRSSLSNATKDYLLSQRRQFSIGSKCLSAQDNEPSKPTPSSQDDDLLQSATSLENLRLRLEFEKYGNVRDYLQKWQDSQDNSADPVRGPGTANKMLATDAWRGNMLNDNREAMDAGFDVMRASDDDAELLNRDDEGAGLNHYLEPGDLVAMSASDGVLSYAIYVRSIAKQQQVYTDKGKWRIAFKRDIEYVVKGFVPRETVAPLLPHFPAGLAEMSSEFQSAIEGGVPRHAGAHLMKKIQEFDLGVREIYRNNALRLDNLHALVADEESNLVYTLEELACKALEIEEDQLDATLLFLIHQCVHENSFLIDHDMSSLFANRYLVRPLRVAKVINTVCTWVHEHQDYIVNSARGKDTPYIRNHPLQQFLLKAQRLIRQSRTVRSPTTVSCVGPSAVRVEPKENASPAIYREVLTEQFNDDDRAIIEYLQHWCLPPRRMTRGHMRSAGSHIMRSTGMYSVVDLGPETATLFLQELGVFHPWENTRLLDHRLALPGHGIFPEHDKLWAKVAEEAQLLADKSQLEDSMKDLRVDWGDLKVYCVDDTKAQEIDDGVSLERIPGSDDNFWIHIHVANPTAFMGHESSIMKWAASQAESLYVPERTYPMIPESVTQKHFSLGPGRPTLTFSAKMNLQGDVLDTKVANGTVRNVTYITHDRLRRVFKPDTGATDSTRALSVGGEVPERIAGRRGITETLTPEDEETFHILRQLMAGWREHRRQNGMLEFTYPPRVSVSMSVGSVALPPRKLGATEGRYVLGDPVIKLRQHEIDLQEVRDDTTDNLISLLMNLGCWVSASWLSSRNIPAVYDGTQYHPEYRKVTRENMERITGQEWLNMAAPTGVSLSRPIPHVSLGLDAYVKSTSPLRRYIDVVAHYQIEAALRFEHAHNRRFDAAAASEPEDRSVLPFSAADVDRWLARSLSSRLRLRECERGSRQFWACLLFFRAFYFAECPLPATFECQISKRFDQADMTGAAYTNGWAGILYAFGVRCQILVPPRMPDADKVDVMSMVEAKVTRVDMARMLVVMEATRFLRGSPAQLTLAATL